MTKKPMVRIYVNADEYIDREMNDAELAQVKIDKEMYETYQAELKAETEAKATAKAALLTQLGITEEQAKLLLS